MKGRPLTAAGELEERTVQAASMRHELVANDRYETAAYLAILHRVEAAATAYKRGGSPLSVLREVAAIVGELQRRDVRENRIHGEIHPDAVLL